MVPSTAHDVYHIIAFNIQSCGYVFISHCLACRDGAISFWNISNKVATQFLDMAQLHEEESYKRKMVQWEKEEMEYRLVSTETRLHKSDALDLVCNL